MQSHFTNFALCCFKQLLFNGQVPGSLILPTSYLVPSILTTSFSLIFQNSAFLVVPGACILMSSLSLLALNTKAVTAACREFLVVLQGGWRCCRVLIVWAHCPSGASSKSSSWSCQNGSLLWPLCRCQVPCKRLENMQAACSLLSLVAATAVSGRGYIYLHFSLSIQNKHISHPPVITASEKSSFIA